MLDNQFFTNKQANKIEIYYQYQNYYNICLWRLNI